MKRLLVGLLLFVGMIVLFTSMSYAEPGYLYVYSPLGSGLHSCIYG